MTDTHTIAHIPDEAVQAAAEATKGIIPEDFLIAALTAALPHLSAPCAVEVDVLANEIRRVNGSNNLGAGALAEALMPFLSCVVTKPVDVAAVRKEVFEEAACRLDAEAEEAIIRSENCSDDMYDEFYNDGQHFKQSAAIVRALSAEPAQGQWQPIATAPKGVSVLLLRGNGTTLIEDWQRFYQSNHPNFTHWMPIPAAPTAEAGKCS